jgi:hypothetical protein
LTDLEKVRTESKDSIQIQMAVEKINETLGKMYPGE